MASLRLPNTPSGSLLSRTPQHLCSWEVPGFPMLNMSHARERCCLYCGLAHSSRLFRAFGESPVLCSYPSCSNGYALLIKEYSFIFAGLCGLRCGWKFHGVFPMQEAQYFLWVLSFSPCYYCPGQVTFGPWRDDPIVIGYPWLLWHKPHFNWSTNTVLV